MEKIIQNLNHDKILIHQNTHTKLKKELEKDTNAEINLTTSDLKYTKGEKQSFEKIPDLVIFIFGAYEPIETTKSIINQYITNSNMILIGKKKSGIKRIVKNLKSRKKFYSGNFQVTMIPKQEKTNTNIEKTEFSFKIGRTKLQINAREGLFSYKKLDPGTKFFLKNVNIENDDEVLDFGCGYGSIGLWFAKKYPQSKITMVDSDLRAIKSAKKNKKTNNLENINIKESYLLDNISGSFDKILSNPPTHTNLYEIRELLKGFSSCLKKGGEVNLVTNKELHYEDIGENIYGEVSEITRNENYKILKFK